MTDVFDQKSNYIVINVLKTMSLTLLLKVNRFIQRIENVLPQIFGRTFPPGKMFSSK